MTEPDRAFNEDLDSRISGFVHELARRIGRREYAVLKVSSTLNSFTLTVEYPEPLLAAASVPTPKD